MSEFLGSLYTTYAYDPLGNRTLKNDSGALTSYAYNAGNAQILLTPPSSGLPTTSSYDANGNLTQENTGGALTINGWDPENRLLTATASGQTQSYTYSANGQRQLKLVGSQTTYFVWDGENVLQEANASLVTQGQYLDLPGVWGGLISQSRANGSSFYGFDLQQSTRLLIGRTGLVTDTYSYKAYGELLALTGSTPNSLRYVGQCGYYTDTASRLSVRARHLEPAIGRWISRDPIGFDGGDWNLYRYVGNLPTISIDPSGLAYHTCSEIVKCLTPVSKYPCTGCSGCGNPSAPNLDMYIAICDFQWESCRNDQPGNIPPPGCGPDSQGGIGQLTCNAIPQLQQANCAEGTGCSSSGLPTGTQKAQWCQGARAAWNFMRCVGLQGYRGKGKKYPIMQINNCARCLRKSGCGNSAHDLKCYKLLPNT